MTDPTEPTDPAAAGLDPLDELASAYVDGQTTKAETARVDGDPELQARVQRLLEVREAVRASATGPVDAERREAALAAALAAADEHGLGRGAVTSLADVAAQRRGPSPRSRRLLGVAAAAALAALALVPALRNLGDDDHHDEVAASADADAETQQSAKTANDGAAADSLATEAAPMLAPDAAAGSAAASSGGPIALGSYRDLPALNEGVRAALTPTTTTVPTEAPTPTAPPTTAAALPPDPATATCLDRSRADAELGGDTVVFAGTAEVDGRPVAVSVSEAPDGKQTEVVTDPAADCATVSNTPL